jgi:hypothetical protein
MLSEKMLLIVAYGVRNVSSSRRGSSFPNDWGKMVAVFSARLLMTCSACKVDHAAVDGDGKPMPEPPQVRR